MSDRKARSVRSRKRSSASRVRLSRSRPANKRRLRHHHREQVLWLLEGLHDVNFQSHRVGLISFNLDGPAITGVADYMLLVRVGTNAPSGHHYRRLAREPRWDGKMKTDGEERCQFIKLIPKPIITNA